MHRSKDHALALNFARWRNKVPADAECVTYRASPPRAPLPQGLREWLERTTTARARIAFVQGQEWWAYEFVAIGAARRNITAGGRIYFVIASSDRMDPEWGADHCYIATGKQWSVGPAASEPTRHRLSSPQTKA